MNTLTKICFIFSLVGITTLSPCVSAQGEPDRGLQEEAFRQPPDSARPHTYWFWMNGNVSKEGITADLEAMKNIGLGGTQIFNIDPDGGMPPGTARFMSESWRDLVKHAVSESSRLGLDLCLHNCAGWSSSGGTWNTPENAMQMIVTSERQVHGPARFSEVLPRPRANRDFYRDIAVLAFKTPKNALVQETGEAPTITASEENYNTALIVDGKPETAAPLPAPSGDKLSYIQWSFPEPREARSLMIMGLEDCQGKLETSTDGKNFEMVRELAIPRKGMREQRFYCNFKPLNNRFYRLVFTSSGKRNKNILNIAEIELSREVRTENLEAKAAYTRSDSIEPPKPIPYSNDDTISHDAVIDLTDRLDASSGRLDWDMPEGKWTILRVGSTLTGATNHPAAREDRGLECDKLSRTAVKAHWDGAMQKIISDVGPLAGKALKSVLIDSYEVGTQNWTPAFRTEFLKRRGYDLIKFLPAFGGHIVDSPEITDRFFWDIRRTVADLVTENYYGYFAELAHQRGMLLSVEPYGSGLFEDLANGASGDLNLGEFWVDYGEHPSLKLAASVAHTNGKTIVGAEAFTAQPKDGRWLNHPFTLKASGDKAYTRGVNRFYFHRFAHQPWLNVFPGMTMGRWGFHFERTNTWWDQSVAWIDYIKRCQYLLQQGRFVADACFHTGENAPSTLTNGVRGDLPAGFDYDGCSTQVVMDMQVKDGRIVLPSGMSYAVLVLKDSPQMTPQLLAKVGKLIEDGATVVGRKPEKSPSLNNYPECDREVAKLASVIWGKCDGKSVKENANGKGKIVWGKPLGTVLKEKGDALDFETDENQKVPSVIYIHRRTADADIYFVSNQKLEPVEVKATFRVEGKVPELWEPRSGQMQKAAAYFEKEGRTTVPLRFGPADSVFVVFRKSAAAGADPIVAVKRDGEALLSLGSASSEASKTTQDTFELTTTAKGAPILAARKPGSYEISTASGKMSKVEVPSVPAPFEIAGPWKVDFRGKVGAPVQATFDRLISWPEHADKQIKYFPGTANYSLVFEVPGDLPAKDRKLYLDLGKVEILAEVILNGKNLGVLWKPPFRVDVSDVLRAGKNSLEVKVTNLWPNRLIGDEQLPDDRKWKKTGKEDEAIIAEWPQWLLDGQPSPTGRMTFTTFHHWKKEDKLLPSGLLGPVQIQVTQTKAIP